jgi:hypothetical protein
MREKPTLLLLHGGPGFDHSIYKPAYSAWGMLVKPSISKSTQCCLKIPVIALF